MRFSQLVQQGLQPLLKDHPTISVWVPLSQAEMNQKHKRQEEAGLATAKGRGNAAVQGLRESAPGPDQITIPGLRSAGPRTVWQLRLLIHQLWISPAEQREL